ncbi:hypothetical protein N7493_006671 [Penicillium malachiteum]|uniref:Uncharacterized protein n=1 Tax=Penicillium malachiteum TaxID=1324776 RepID=A0AAD6HLQ6_9EURO|nr:hypothetical protein N7493_006671 [Penicillium malachiteum]
MSRVSIFVENVGIQQQALERSKNLNATAHPHLTDNYSLECFDHTKTPPVYTGMTQHTLGQFKRHVHYDDSTATLKLAYHSCAKSKREYGKSGAF